MQTLLFIIALIPSFLSVPDLSFLPIPGEQQISHSYYILSYNEDAEQANWVYYKLTKEMLEGDVERNSNFRNDPLVTTKSASTKDYTNSGYDRGHLCPAADMKFDVKAMYESFYMSNITPQNPDFNRGIWKELESQVRTWVREKDSLYVITGPILSDNDNSIGANEVKVPNYFYKVLYDPAQNKVVAFIIPNQSSAEPFENFATSIDSLEIYTGIDFFSQLPDRLENRLESKIDLVGWFSDVAVSTSIPTKKPNNSLVKLILALSGIIIVLLIFRKRT